MSADPVTFRIKDWDEVFEDYRSRPLQTLKYLQLPLRRPRGDVMNELMRTPEGHALYGVFIVLSAFAATCKVRGVLADERGAFTPERLAPRVGIPPKHLVRAWSKLASKEIGWLVPAEDVERPLHPKTALATPPDGSAHRPRIDRASVGASAPPRPRADGEPNQKEIEINKTEPGHPAPVVPADEGTKAGSSAQTSGSVQGTPADAVARLEALRRQRVEGYSARAITPGVIGRIGMEPWDENAKDRHARAMVQKLGFTPIKARQLVEAKGPNGRGCPFEEAEQVVRDAERSGADKPVAAAVGTLCARYGISTRARRRA